MRNKVVNWLLFVISIALFLNIVRTMADLSRQDNIIKEAEDRLERIKAENEKMQRDQARAQSSQFIEREARNKLNLGKEGEIVLLLPSISPVISPTPTPVDDSASWKKWLKLFL